ncbi:MAG: hypothetical protein JST47_04255 [Bacteroidetes bacterium]|nr:hypothetical protein [Bacteroidota bacterium]
MKIGILTRPDNKSPKILAQTLAESLKQIGIDSEVVYGLNMLRRQVLPLRAKDRYQLKLHFRIRQKIKYFFADRAILKKLKQFDFIIVSECIPNAYWADFYPIERLRKILKKKIGLFEVFYLGSAPHFIKELEDWYGKTFNEYDFELAIAPVSYTASKSFDKKFDVGFNLKSSGLAPQKKNRLIALIDFAFEGYEAIREMQLRVLQKLDIEYIELKGAYSIHEIRELYAKAGIFFLQHFESFGLPIAECLSYGTAVFTAHSGWPMAFRLNENPELYGEGQLADCFYVYGNEKELEEKLLMFIKEFDGARTPLGIFNTFTQQYGPYYYGNAKGLDKLKRYLDNEIAATS